MIVAEFRIIPVGADSSMEPAVERALEAVRETGIRHKVEATGTTMESESLDEIFTAVKKAHTALQGDCPRIVTEVFVDDRRDAPETAKGMVEEVAEGRPPW